MSNNPIIDRINVKGIEYEIKDTTNNTAGATNDTSKLFLVGAKSQAANPQTYSNSKVYMTDGALTTDSLKTARIYTKDQDFIIKKDNNNIAVFHSNDSANGETYELLTGHLVVWGQNDSSNMFKPADQTGFSDLDTYYFNTGIALQNAADLTTYKLSFPGKDGTIALTSDLPTTQQWTLTSTSGTVTTVNICIK